MKRVKRTTLFRKNHIEITKEEFPMRTLTPGVIKTYSGSSDNNYYWGIRSYKKRKVIKKSPLGFYYEKIEEERPDLKKGKHSSSWSGTVYRISLPNIRYTLTYLTSNGKVRIEQGHGTRPWDLDFESGAMSDHFIQDLKTEVDKLLNIISENKLHENPSNLKREIYTDLFGFPRGPMYQTDLEKIESHGFDTKVSFRRRKE